MSSTISKQPKSAIYLIDASIYIFRAYFSLPDSWTASNGYSTNAVYGYTLFLLDLLERTKGDPIAAAFDESLGTCFRNEIYDDYKANRAPPDEELAFQLTICRKVTEILGINTFACERFEADDYLGSLAQRVKRSTKPIVFVTRDKDIAQLLRKQDFIWDYAANQWSNSDDIVEQFGVKPDQLVDYLALVGDPVDYVPGVPGVGKKTAVHLLNHFSSINHIYLALDQVSSLPIRGAKGIQQRLMDNASQVEMSQKLTKIKTNIDLDIGVKDLKPQPIDEGFVLAFFDELGFGSRFKTRFKRFLES